MNVQSIAIESYDYPLEDSCIARYPLEERDSSKLLLYRAGDIAEHRFAELPDLLPAGSVLVRNNSKVIRARIHLRKPTGAEIEIFCLDPSEPTSYEESLSAREACSWHCLIGNAKRWRSGILERVVQLRDDTEVVVVAERIGEGEVRFSWHNPAYTFGELLEAMGELPIPPYLGREAEEQDLKTYQTVYAQHEGSVAAPTAGLHFTPEVFTRLEARGASVVDVTLHVGAGTFRPVKSDLIGEHEMHSELISVSRAALEQLHSGLGRIIAIGTTSVRTLESLYHLAVRLHRASSKLSPEELCVSQWDPYALDANELSSGEAIETLLAYLETQGLEQLIFPTAIMIAPGYRFRIVRGLVTNFHQPRSTLLLLISALIGEDWRSVYDYALAHDFRFLSYGDSSLLLPSPQV